ncbi:TIM barrel protein [Conexibacter stalactiti]|uniref:TIM barrel protein n=1 Tax=Conexibacter stalactiti TaxID=1940611 RepID=A0ABU4HLA6_9ACTN|nr:TIM barrel protein [Conexibacter stalactiti]MDW5594093.1 TIM barrel protein [Conexibacter stalactiti]MEC5034735.1 TIM barrel protein [Conexibacter stalactiti]
MDLWFYHSLGTYEFDVRCEMLQQLGYDGMLVMLWSEPAWATVPRLGGVRERFGIDVTSVFTYVEELGDAAHLRRIERLLRDELDGSRRLELAILSGGEGVAPSDPRGDERVLPVLERLLAAAEERSIELSLYPHESWWMERTEDAVRLCERLAHPLLRVTFSAYHWYATDGRDLTATLAAAAPHLASANLSGATRVAGAVPAHHLLDEGELDTFAVLGGLRDAGYEGPLHLLGYTVGGDVHAKLRRSLESVRELERRLDRHPAWARLSPDVFPYLPAVLERDAP